MVYDELLCVEEIPFGSPVRCNDDGHLIKSDVARMFGIATRHPRSSLWNFWLVGERVKYQSEGHIMAEIDGQSQWVELRKGKICQEQ